MVKVTGKVKLIAVSSAVPRRLTKNVSTRLNVNIMNMPTIIGRVIRISDARIGPSTRLCFCFWVDGSVRWLVFDDSFDIARLPCVIAVKDYFFAWRSFTICLRILGLANRSSCALE